MRSAALALLLCACSGGAGAQPALEPLEVVEVRTGGAAGPAELPLVVGLHGRGDRPESFAGLFDGFPVAARVIVPRAPQAWGEGYAWFERARAVRENQAPIARELVRNARRVQATIAAVRRTRPTRGPTIVVGFSQGAMLAYVMALRYPDGVGAVFPVSGLLFPHVLRGARLDPARVPPIVALHGRTDDVVPLGDDANGVRLLRARGVRVELREHDAPHTITAAMQAELFREMAAALAR
jgi:phospholipase/carboxylesterase